MTDTAGNGSRFGEPAVDRQRAGTYEMTPTAGMSREEWLRLRKTGIGGSDAGAICGLEGMLGANCCEK